MSAHVGDRLSALVDGELDHEERDQLLAHVTCCPSCRQALEAERRVHALVGSLGDESVAPDPSSDMIASLLRLGDDTGSEAVGPGGVGADGTEEVGVSGRAAGSSKARSRLGTAALPAVGRSHGPDRVGQPDRPGQPDRVGQPGWVSKPGRPATTPVGASTRPARLSRSGSRSGGFGRSGLGTRLGRHGGAARPQRPPEQRSGALSPAGAGSTGGAAGATAGISLLRQGPSRRFALGVAGAASAFGMTAALAFTLNGAPSTAPQVNVTPPTQQMGVEDAKIIPDYPAPGSGVVTELVESPTPTIGTNSGSATPFPVQGENR